MGLSTFCRLRDKKRFRGVHYTNSNVCLCLQHANVHLMLKVNSQLPVDKKLPSSSTDLCALSDEDIKQKLEHLSDKVKFDRWEKVKLIHKEKEIIKHQYLNKEMTKMDFIDLFVTTMVTFRPHCNNVETIQGI